MAYLKAGPQDRTYSDYLRAAHKAEKEDTMELSQRLQTQTTNNVPKPQATKFFPLQKLKGDQPVPKTPIVHLAHLEEEGAGRDEDEASDDPSRIEEVTKEFMVCLVRAVKDNQTEEKYCYHHSSMEHFICNCLLVKTLRENTQLNHKEGTALRKGTQIPQIKPTMPKNPHKEVPKV